MSGFRTPEQPRDQLVLWERRLDDAMGPDHPVRLFDEILRSEAFRETFSKWEECYVLSKGKPPYHPRDLVALYLYGMMNRIRSSRQLESATYNRLDVIWLISGQHPDHSTIAGFVRSHRKWLRQLHKNVLKIAVAAGLVQMQHVAYDSTMIAADASKSSLKREDHLLAEMQSFDNKLDALEQEWQENERRETVLWKEKPPWIPPKTGSLKQRMARMKRQQERLKLALKNISRRRDQSRHSTPPTPIASATDPDCRMMPSKEGGHRPNYNAHIGVDAASGVIVAVEVSDHPGDGGQLVPLLAQTESSCGRLPKEVSADSNYNIGPDLAAMEKMGVTAYLPASNRSDNDFPRRVREVLQAHRHPTGREDTGPIPEDAWSLLPKDSRGRITKDTFEYDSSADVYRCPMGKVLAPAESASDHKNWGKRIRRFYRRRKCVDCPRATQCCSDPRRGRVVSRDQYEGHRERLRERLAVSEGRTRMALRRQTVEPRFGLIKHVLGFRRFLHRGADAVRAEWTGVSIAVNLGIFLRRWKEVQPAL